MEAQILEFIKSNINTDLASLLMKKSPFPDVAMQEIVQQIKGRRIAEKKFPFLLKDGIVFPPNLNLEQSSSELTGNYKKSLARGKKMLDLTGGFGIDAYFLSDNFEECTLVEQNSELLKIVESNWKFLDKKARFYNQRLEEFLNANNEFFDLVFLDPARRDEQKNKVFLLEDLSPNILDIQDTLLDISHKIMLKLSPLINISYLVSTIKNIAEIHIVAVKNDVKEVLVLIDCKKSTDKILIKSINLETSEPGFEFYFGDDKSAKPHYNEPQRFICLPNNSVLKSGAFNLVCERFALKKLHPNTHIYTSEKIVNDFPGRILEMEVIDSKSITKNSRFNIISKNHPLRPEEIKKKYKLEDGGSQYLIFTQSQKGKIILKSL